MTQTRKGIPNLSVHRNTRSERQGRDMRKSLVVDAKMVGGIEDISGYAIVTWNDEWGFRAGWRLTGTTPSVIMPEFVKGCLERELVLVDIRTALEPVPDKDG